jgi:hypothetical protein
MPVFMVSYDLRKKDEFDYEKLWDEFDKLQGVKFQESAYLVDLNNNAEEVRDHFQTFAHPDDLLMVIEVTKRPKWSKALKGTTDWVNAHFP